MLKSKTQPENKPKKSARVKQKAVPMKASIIISESHGFEELKALYAAKNYKSALRVCEKLSESAREDPTLIYVKANCLLFLDEIFQAIEVGLLDLLQAYRGLSNFRGKSVLILRHLPSENQRTRKGNRDSDKLQEGVSELRGGRLSAGQNPSPAVCLQRSREHIPQADLQPAVKRRLSDAFGREYFRAGKVCRMY